MLHCPHDLWWYGSVLSESVSFQKTCKNTDEVNAEQTEGSVCVHIRI